MSRNIHNNFYEDNYMKYECQDCRRKFIVGERLSKDMELTCPYCQSSDIESTAMADEMNMEEMQMGCVGIYFHTYADGTLMLYTEKEFAQAMNEAFFDKGIKSVPLGGHHVIMSEFCENRDKREANNGIVDYLESLGYEDFNFTLEPGMIYISIMQGRIEHISPEAIEYIRKNKPTAWQFCVRRIINSIPSWHEII